MVYAFGEILWDIFGDTRSIGGAPFNFAAHFASLGGAAALISAVGEDLLGDEALRAMRSFGVSERLVQRIAERPTGTCAVTLDGGGVPQYRLASETAFDAIGYTDALRAALACPQGDVLYFGTLAQRDETSRSTLRAIAARPFRERFCDLNLRPPFLDEEVILHACGNATILKLSLEECEHLRAIGLLGSLAPERICDALCARFPNIRLLLLTLGKDGAMLCSPETGPLWSIRPESKAVSTVGAGDSFAACFLYNYLAGHSLQECLNRGVLLSDYVVTQTGAVPSYPAALRACVR